MQVLARADTVPTVPAQQPSRSAQRTRKRVGVIGLGKQALEDHVPAAAGAESAELVAVCDGDEEVLSLHRQRLGVPGYTDPERMFRDEELDLVVVCVPHSAGRDVILAAADAGVHVLKEKPFALTLSEAEELERHCAQAGIQVMVTLQRRFNPIYISFPQLADQVGTPFLIDAAYTLHVDDPSDGWRGRIDVAGGGCVIDMGYHVIDLLIWYFGLPDRVLADLSVKARPDRSYDAEDSAIVHFSYDRGLYGSLLLSRYLGPKSENVRLVGSRGIVHLERGRIRRLTNSGEVVESLSREQGWPSAASSQLDYFCRVIDGDRPNLSGPGKQLDHLRFVSACYESARLGSVVNPKELA